MALNEAQRTVGTPLKILEGSARAVEQKPDSCDVFYSEAGTVLGILKSVTIGSWIVRNPFVTGLASKVLLSMGRTHTGSKDNQHTENCKNLQVEISETLIKSAKMK